MKSFAQILQESKKVYSFNIGLAGDLPEGVEDRLESVLKKFNVLSFTKSDRREMNQPKKTETTRITCWLYKKTYFRWPSLGLALTYWRDI